MPYNGSGGVTQPGGSIYPAVGNTLIESAKANASIADIYTMLATCLLKDGQQVATARIPFASGIATDTVTEKTTDTGVTVDSVLLKDGRIDTTQGADIVCAATINLETATGNVVDVTGSTGPVTAITLSQGHWRIVRFTSTPTLTHGASLVLPGAANITAAAGDYALFIGYAASVVRCAMYIKASGIQVTGTQSANTFFAGPTSGAAAAPSFRAAVGADGASLVLIQSQAASNSATIDFTTGISSTYDTYILEIEDLVVATDNVNLHLLVSENAGGAWKVGASDYAWTQVQAQDATGTPNQAGDTADAQLRLQYNTLDNALPYRGTVKFSKPSGTARSKMFMIDAAYRSNTTTIERTSIAGAYIGSTAAIDGIRIIASSGNITTGTLSLYGVRKA